jgi:hypothetical protein
MAQLYPYQDALRLADLTPAALTGVVGSWIRFAKYVVPAGQRLLLGYGLTAGQANAQGRAFVDLNTVAPAHITGKIRVVLCTPDDRPIRVLWTADLTKLETAVGDPTKQEPFPIREAGAGRDYILSFEVLLDAAVLINIAASTLTMDITRYSRVA